jgi:hypothetical protein
MTRRLWEIFLVKCQKQAFSFNKREAKVNCYAFLQIRALKHEENFFLVSCGARVPARHAKMPWLEPWKVNLVSL